MDNKNAKARIKKALAILVLCGLIVGICPVQSIATEKNTTQYQEDIKEPAKEEAHEITQRETEENKSEESIDESKKDTDTMGEDKKSEDNETEVIEVQESQTEDEEGNELEDVKEPEPIKEKLEIEVTELDIKIDKNDINKIIKNNICIGFTIPYTVSATVSAKGIEGNEGELGELLDTYLIEIASTNGTKSEIKSVTLSEYKNEIISGDETITFSGTIKSNTAGTFEIKAQSGTIEVKTSLLIDKLPQNMQYTPDIDKELYEYGAPVIYKREGTTHGAVTCYESDENGNKLSASNNLNFKNANSTITVTAQNVSDENTPFYFTIEDAGNDIYQSEIHTYKFQVDKINLSGNVTLTPLENGKWFFKTKCIYVEINIKSENKNYNLNTSKKDISFDLDFYDDNNISANRRNVRYTFRGVTYSEGTLTYLYEVNYNDSKKLSSELSVTATARYTKDKYRLISLKSANAITKQSQIEIESPDITLELNNDTTKIYYNLTTDMPYNYSNYPVEVKFESLNEDIISVDENGYFKTLKGGEATIRITVDDMEYAEEEDKCDLYEENTKDITITVTPPTNIDFTVNGQNSHNILENPNVKIGTENWYDNELVIKNGQNNIYTTLVYRKKGDENWTNVDMTNDGCWSINNDTIASYEFYFEDFDRKVKSEQIIEINNVGIDIDTPDLDINLTTNAVPSTYSTSKVAYFPTDVTLKARSSKDSETETAPQTAPKSIDSGSGVEKLVINYRRNETLEESREIKIDEADRYNTYYEVTLDKDRDYATVEIIAVDYLGHESSIATYEREICIDKAQPVVTLSTETTYYDGYNGKWTNKPVKFILSSLEETQVSGIHSYQYAVVPKGKNIAPEWKRADKDSLYIIFGSDDPSQYAKINATIYVRAESNAGLSTTKEDIEKTKKEIRIWQQNLKEATVNFDRQPDPDTGWYNKGTGEVTISFEYPEYDEENFAPAVGIVYSLTSKTSDESGESIIERRFYKGIIDEDTDKVIEVSDYNDAGKTTSLKNDGTIRIDKDSINKLTIYTEDAAGNKSALTEYEIKADYNAPDNLTATADQTDLKVYLSDSGKNPSYVIFSPNAVNVSASAEYGISGRGSLIMELTKHQQSQGPSSTDRDLLTIEPCNRGLVYICATDKAGNKTEGWTDGIVVDNIAPKDIIIKTDGENASGFYNADIPIEIEVSDMPKDDNYSGLKSIAYQVGRNTEQLSEEIVIKENPSGNISWEQIQSMFSYGSKGIVIDADQNESNSAVFKVTATDNAGNISSTTKELKIDVTAPVIEISFDKNNANNQIYYNTVRTARIDITELNFDPSLVELTIYKDKTADTTVGSKLTSWTSGENSLHTAYITFDTDGDYYFEVKCKDLADNESTQVTSQQFTIDMTKPIISVTYDDNIPYKENYYSKSRTATITVTEHNFDEKDFTAVIEPRGNITGWVNNGDEHRAHILFDEEDYYIYTLAFTDLAGNQADDFGAEDFYIDLTPPLITITGVANRSANSGDINPIVHISDLNFDTEGIEINLTNSKGCRIAVERVASAIENGYDYFLANVNGQPDEIYTLTANATDMAGNKSESTIKFSLNRQGSVYDLSQISSLSGRGYIRSSDMEDFHITEMNVSAIDEFILVITKNNKAVTALNVASRPYSTKEDTVYYSVSSTGNDDIGYIYDYTIYRESFAGEGVYNAMFYSKDAAGNEVNNTLNEKDAKLTFIIDNTAPDVAIDGLDSEMFRFDEEKKVNVYIKDNFKLSQGYFELVNEDGVTIRKYDYMELAENEGDIVAITLPSSEKYMSLQYYACDGAGNEIMSVREEKAPKSAGITTDFIANSDTKEVALALMACAVIILLGISIKMHPRT
jgi:hypothetical protein